MTRRFRDTLESSDERTPTRKAKPAEVTGAEIWGGKEDAAHFCGLYPRGRCSGSSARFVCPRGRSETDSICSRLRDTRACTPARASAT